MADVSVTLTSGAQYPVTVNDSIGSAGIAAALSNIEVSIDAVAGINATVAGGEERVVTLVTGAPGQTGPQGNPGPSPTLSVDSLVVTGTPGTASLSGTVSNPVLHLTLPSGGDTFDQTLNTTSDVVFNSVSIGGGAAQIDSLGNFGDTNAVIGVGAGPSEYGVQGLLIQEKNYDLCDFALQTNTQKTYSARLEGRSEYCHGGNSMELQFSYIPDPGTAIPRFIVGDSLIAIGGNGENIQFSNGAAEFDSLGNLTAANFPQTIPVTSVAGKTGDVTLSNSDISGLGAFATLSTAPASLISGLSTVATTGKYSDLVSIPSAFAPSAHKSSHASGGSDSLTPADIGAAPTSHTHTKSQITDFPTLATVATSGSYVDLSGKPTLGTSSSLDVAAAGNASSTQVVKGSDTRLSDSRTPTAHASSHASGGSDPLTLSTTQITGFSTAAASAAPVQSVAGRTGAVTLTNADVSGLGSMATINDAVSDGNQYARKNGAWVTVSGGTGSVDLSSPGPIGNTTPSTGKFTTVTLTGSLTGSASGTILTDGDTLGGYSAGTVTIAGTTGIYLRSTSGSVNVIGTSLSNGSLTVAGQTVWHQGNSIRAWGTITDTAGTGTGSPSLVGSKNVTSVSRHASGVGQYDVLLSSAMPDANYTVIVTIQPVTWQSAVFTTTQFSATIASRAMVSIKDASNFTIVCLNGSNALQNPARLSFAVISA